MRFILSVIFISLFATTAISQKTDYAVLLIPDTLKVNANAVIRLDQTDITIESQRDMSISEKRVVTVLNEKGLDVINAMGYYNKKTTIKSIEAVVYDASGTELKKIRRKDFRDQSLSDGITIAIDARILYLDYTPTQYPFTIVFESETTTSNTAFIPQWRPIADFFVSVQKSVLNVSFPENLGFHRKESNFAGFGIDKTIDMPKQLSYTAANIPAQKEENFSPQSSSLYPRVMMGLELFSLEGVDGNAKDWKEFGKWYSEKILTGTTELSEETKTKMIQLVGNEKDPIEKARIIYHYVQQKSRYVSIQLGIGGWRPMPAKDVDRLGYGDCKALSNYTKALLEAVGVASYNTIVYGDRENKRNIERDIVSVQGNHMILAVPNGENYIWLECTSQDIPFGYQANFTDDRNVLVIKPGGAEIVKTKNYENNDNSQISKGKYVLKENGDLSGEIVMVSEGAQYSQKYFLKDSAPNEKDKHYKSFWNNINNLKINTATFNNDRINASFTENVNIAAANYGSVSGNKMLIVVNAFNQMNQNIKRIRNRKSPFEINRGFFDNDEITIELPLGFTIESLPKNCEFNGKYGSYKTELVIKDDTHLIYTRSFHFNKGLYASNEYEDYRLFMEQVARNDNAKIILTKIQ